MGQPISDITRPSRILTVLGVGASLVLGIVGCAPGKPPRPPSASSAPPRPAADASPRQTSTAHNWLYRDGQAYAYQGDASADQARAGRSTPAVQLYRYLGQRDGVFALQVDGDTATCANPCEVITLHAGGFHVERLAFDPDSVIGAAFTDAFNGQMEIYDPARRAPR